MVILPPNESASYGFVAETSALFTYTEEGDTRRELFIPEVQHLPPSLRLPSDEGNSLQHLRRSPTSPRGPSLLTSRGWFASQLRRAGKMWVRELSSPCCGPWGTPPPPKKNPGLGAALHGSAGRWVPAARGRAGAPAREVPATPAPRLRSLAEKVQNTAANNNRKKCPTTTTTTKNPTHVASGQTLP